MVIGGFSLTRISSPPSKVSFRGTISSVRNFPPVCHFGLFSCPFSLPNCQANCLALWLALNAWARSVWWNGREKGLVLVLKKSITGCAFKGKLGTEAALLAFSIRSFIIKQVFCTAV